MMVKLFLFCDINSKSKDSYQFDIKISPTCILVGPEGDFSEEEREL